MGNRSLSFKLVAGFLSVAFVLFIVGVMGYKSVGYLEAANESVLESSPLTDGAMEMMLALSNDQTLLMEILECDSFSELDELWKKHEEVDASFDKWSTLLLKGGETDTGHFPGAKDPEMLTILEAAAQKHDSEFASRLKKVKETKRKQIQIMAEQDKTMTKMEESCNELCHHTEELENLVKELMSKGKADGKSATALLAEEVTWADASMELRLLATSGRVAVEEVAQAHEFKDINGPEKVFRESTTHFGELVERLVSGGEFEGEKIVKLPSGELGDLANELREHFGKEYIPLSRNFFEGVRKEVETKELLAKLDEETDKTAKMLAKEFEKIEDRAASTVVKVATEAQQTAQAAKNLVTFFVLVGTVLAVALGLIISRLISRPLLETIENLKLGAMQVKTASDQVAQTGQGISQGASEQASSLEEISSSLEEMTSMTKESAEKLSAVSDVADRANDAVTRGSATMERMGLAISKIKSSSDDTAKIIKTIDEIAFQTNLLALNAAVEAARAGDAGKGFAVVAEEVRSLAQRSAEAAKDTANLIEESQKNSDEGVQVAEEVQGLLTELRGAVENVASLSKECTAASDEQRQGIDQINRAVANIDAVTQNSASSAEESASAAEELSGQAKDLDIMVKQLAFLIAGESENGSEVVNFDNSPKVKSGIKTSLNTSHELRHLTVTRKDARPAPSLAPHEMLPLSIDELADF